jgi:radical SAM superfamily enzyme YgiQ (UPF0313 family)
MANLGYHYIYRTLREQGVSVERFFASPVSHRSVERDTLVERFQVILGGISYEGDAYVFAKWLEAGGISPSRVERERDVSGKNNNFIVGAGGAVTYINPFLLSGIADFIVLGDGVEATRYVVETMRSEDSRERVLPILAQHPSIYVPSIHKHGTHRLEVSRRDIDLDFGCGNWVTPRTAFGKTLLIELQRGCVRGCGFCTLPACFSPPRQRMLELVKRDIIRVASVCDFNQIGLVTPEAGDYKELDELLNFAENRGIGISFASLRVDGMTAHMVRALVRGGRHSVTVAPESGDDDLRSKCGKNFTNDHIIETLYMAKDEGVRSVKLYFMIGLPGEDDEHIMSISKLCDRVRNITGLRVTATISPFVPKPGTRWANEHFGGGDGANGEKILKSKYAVLSRSFGGSLRGIAQKASVKEACLEYALSWATPAMSEFLATEGMSAFSYRYLMERVDRNETMKEFRRLGLRSNLR